MSVITKPESPWPKFEILSQDGRRQRSGRSRRRIIEALFDLLSQGNMSPTAAAVAERANVGLRTVFRHFEDMESIYLEMTEELETAIMPKILAPYEAHTWRDRILEAADKRAEIYESVFPMKVCMSLRSVDSDVLRKQYDRDVETHRAALKAILPEEVTADPKMFAALEVTLSFATWRRLRQDQKMSREAATETVKLMLQGLIAGTSPS